MAPTYSALHATVRGHVQGVFFRASVVDVAQGLGLTGWVRNLPSGVEVEVWAEGARPALDRLLDYLHRGPPRAHVERVVAEWPAATGQYREFATRY
ncbi:MAG: acylphosphatase [Chloroflexi bacterium]|nr:acylphosphatase [Chloroflexota bacterium]